MILKLIKLAKQVVINGRDALQELTQQLRSVLRIVTALLFMQHGSAKLFDGLHQATFDHLHLTSLLGVQGLLEFFGGLLLLEGLLSRPVAFLLAGDMAWAAMFDQSKGDLCCIEL